MLQGVPERGMGGFRLVSSASDAMVPTSAQPAADVERDIHGRLRVSDTGRLEAPRDLVPNGTLCPVPTRPLCRTPHPAPLAWQQAIAEEEAYWAEASRVSGEAEEVYRKARAKARETRSPVPPDDFAGGPGPRHRGEPAGPG